MNQPHYRQGDPGRDPGAGHGPGLSREGPPTRRSRRSWLLLVAVAAVILVAGSFLLTGCAPVEEVDVADVTEDGPASAPPGDETVSLSGEVGEILTESALTVTDEQSEDPLLVLLTPATMMNGTTATLGGQPSLAQVIPPEGTLQLIGTIETFDSVALADRLGIVLNDELFAPWEGGPVLIAQQVETFDLDADVAADTGLESE